MSDADRDELLRLRVELARIRAALETTEHSKRELADAVHWRGGKRDFITDLLAVIRKRAGLE